MDELMGNEAGPGWGRSSENTPTHNRLIDYAGYGGANPHNRLNGRIIGVRFANKTRRLAKNIF